MTTSIQLDRLKYRVRLVDAEITSDDLMKIKKLGSTEKN